MKRFNLMPNDSSYNSNLGKKNNSSHVIVNLIPIFIAVLVIYFMHTNNEVAVKSDNVELLKKYTTLKSEYETLSKLQPSNSETENLFSKKDKLKNELLGLESLDREKENFISFLLSLRDIISEKIALLKLEKKYSDIEIEGIAQDNQSISYFMDTLIDSKKIKNIQLKVSEYNNEFGPYKQRFIIYGELI